jgi:hypothetical protein
VKSSSVFSYRAGHSKDSGSESDFWENLGPNFPKGDLGVEKVEIPLTAFDVE